MINTQMIATTLTIATTTINTRRILKTALTIAMHISANDLLWVTSQTNATRAPRPKMTLITLRTTLAASIVRIILKVSPKTGSRKIWSILFQSGPLKMFINVYLSSLGSAVPFLFTRTKSLYHYQIHVFLLAKR